MTKFNSINWISVLIILGGIFVSSCEEPVDLDIAILPPQIVVNSNFAPGQPFQVSITKSKSVLSSETEAYVNDAEVRIFSQGKEVDKLQLKHFQHPLYESRNLLPESGKAYRLEVEVPGYPQVIAEDIVPFPVALETISMDTIEMIGETDERVYKVEINVGFTDPIGAQDYYHLSLYNQILDPADETTPINGFNDAISGKEDLVPLMPIENHEDNPSVVFHYEDGGILFSDEDFDGQKAGLTFYSLISLNNKAKMGKVVGVLRTVSKSYYLYHTSLSRQIANQDRPFVEPISVYSNIENGLGIFSGYTLYRDSVSISASF